MKSKLPISVPIITLNEEKNLERCLKSVSDIASEIVVIDSGSTDATESIARQYGVVFESRPWPGHLEQKNYAIEKCTQPWALSLDADEALSNQLRDNLFNLFSDENDLADGYWLNRKTYYMHEWMNHAWYPEWRLRLIRRNLADWEGTNPHDRMKTPPNTKKLNGDLLHYSYKDLADHFSKTIQYARISAAEAIRKGESFRWHKLMFSPFFRFFKSLVLRRSFLDGWRGWIIAFSSMIACFAKYAFVYELELNRKNQIHKPESPNE